MKERGEESSASVFFLFTRSTPRIYDLVMSLLALRERLIRSGLVGS